MRRENDTWMGGIANLQEDWVDLKKLQAILCASYQASTQPRFPVPTKKRWGRTAG